MIEIKVLIEEIAKGRQALANIEAFYERVVQKGAVTERSPETALVIAELFAKYYTCLETVFLRISQFFENHLADHRWHADLLTKMTLRIEGVREAAIRDETHVILLEFLKFRHFTRYYFDIAYDWDRLDYLAKKFTQARSLVAVDLDAFTAFLKHLDAE